MTCKKLKDTIGKRIVKTLPRKEIKLRNVTSKKRLKPFC